MTPDTAMALPPLLDIRDLSTTFLTPRGRLRAVDRVAFDVRPGETVAIVGESGSGKSVTALSILRLFARGDRTELSGTAHWRDTDGRVRDLLALDQRALADLRGREIAVVFQDPSASLNPVFSIGEQIAETIRRHRPQDSGRARALAAELLRDVGIADAERRLLAYPHQLSGGMRQRVMIAIAIACAPRLLIADEPTTALDVTIQAQILRLLVELKNKRGMGLIFITHDLALVGETADRVVVMYGGQIVETGAATDVLARPRHPYTRALLECRPLRRYRDDGADERVLKPIAGAPPRPTEAIAGCRFAPRCTLTEPECRTGEIALEAVADGRHARCRRSAALP
jgi:oligopeptide/dipeptide ABC transporter ATP-binding protein